jgi:hypothetical protein
MKTVRSDAVRKNQWLIAAASTLLLAGCGGPHAWNTYSGADYYRGDTSNVPRLSVPAEVTGTAGDISTDEFRSILVAQLSQPATAGAKASTVPQEGSSAPDVAPTRIAWAFSGTPASGGAIDVHAEARYYSDNVLISSAEGTAVITGGPSDPRLGELVSDVASQLFPTTPRGGPGRG